MEDFFSSNIMQLQVAQQQQQKQTNSNGILAPLSQTAQKIQQETFLVMSLKKQVKELRTETTKKDEELEVLRKNIKNTKVTETDVEMKTYKEECSRLRSLIDDMVKQGPAHPMHQQSYQERLQSMEQHKQQSEFLIKQLRQDNQDLAMLIKQKDEELKSKEDTSDKKKEIKSELTKAKKTMRDKEKEITKLKSEIV